MNQKNRYLFFFVHPSKFHLFRITINNLINMGHEVDILITSKDVLEDLVKAEGWNYKNIFPEGRKIKWLPTKVGAIINLIRTLSRLFFFTKNKRYNLFITDDLLTFIGKLRNTPTILFQDDDLSAVPESFILAASTSYILAPACANFGRYDYKKIGFKGYKQSAYLLPNQFTPRKKIISKYIDKDSSFVLLRLVSLSATHDVGKNGLSNDDLIKLINILGKSKMVIITSERKLPESLEKYRVNIKPSDMIHFIAYAKLFISDSQTMSAEAGVLGTPYIRFNDFIGKISYLDEIETIYKLGVGIKTNEKTRFFDTVHTMSNNTNRTINVSKHKIFLNETIDLSEFMMWLFNDYQTNIKRINTFSEGKVFID